MLTGNITLVSRSFSIFRRVYRGVDRDDLVAPGLDRFQFFVGSIVSWKDDGGDIHMSRSFSIFRRVYSVLKDGNPVFRSLDRFQFFVGSIAEITGEEIIQSSLDRFQFFVGSIVLMN